MAEDTFAFPMFQAYLRQLDPPDFGILVNWIDWPAGILVLTICSAIPFKDWPEWLGLILGGGTIYGLRKYRKDQVAQLTPAQRLANERWTRVKRIRKLLKDGLLRHAVPQPVMESLERAARSWHDARESLQSMAVSDPEFVEEAQSVLDTLMATATAIAEPVVRRSDQTRKDVRRMEGDLDLMDRVCRKIDAEEQQMKRWIVSPLSTDTMTPEALRTRLSQAQKERADALAELDALI